MFFQHKRKYTNLTYLLALLLMMDSDTCIALDTGYYGSNSPELGNIMDLTSCAAGHDPFTKMFYCSGKFKFQSLPQECVNFGKEELEKKLTGIKERKLLVIWFLKNSPPADPDYPHKPKEFFYPTLMKQATADYAAMKPWIKTLGFRRVLAISPGASYKIGFFVIADDESR